MPRVIDSDQHLFEYRGLWEEHVDPAFRHEALRFEDDALGHVTLRWRDQVLGVADVSLPGETDAIGERRRREREGLPPAARYDDILPRDYWEPAARLEKLDAMGVDEALLFPNYGLGIERTLSVDLDALRANLGAWNRWCIEVAGAGQGRLHPVAHLTLRDGPWLEAQLEALARAGVRTAMIAPALVDGKPLSHPDLARAWAAFADHGIAPVFHVADQPRVFDDAWYTERTPAASGDATSREAGIFALDSIFLYVPAALATTDLILNGVFERHPGLRLGIVELSAVWVPMYLMMLEGGSEFVARLTGRERKLSLRPAEYFRRQVRVSCFAYELPAKIAKQLRSDDVLMACSDYPHSEGTARPLDDYAAGRFGLEPGNAEALFERNAAFLLGAA
ncbi:MAG: amidohydrolase family protein [Myxococcota bacterium]